MEQRLEFVRLAATGGIPFTTLCAGFGIAPKTGYKWLQRYADAGVAGLADRSRRPTHSPHRTPDPVVDQIAALVVRYPTWGGRKLHAVLVARGVPAAPAPSTITAIIQREGLRPLVQPGVRPVTRFEADAPNDRWQLDFMGSRPLRSGKVIPLTLLDDHSRFALRLEAVPDQTRPTVQAVLTACFERYGLPWELLTDNGPPWGSSHPATRTQLEVWLMQLGITVTHGRPRHPQTQGKVERFHRTVQTDVFAGPPFADRAAAQTALDGFRQTYNHDRPHEALGLQPPDRHYQRSPRVWTGTLPPIEYADDAVVRLVTPKGIIRFQGRAISVGEAFQGLPVGVLPTATDGIYRLQFCAQTLRTVDLRQPEAR